MQIPLHPCSNPKHPHIFPTKLIARVYLQPGKLGQLTLLPTRAYEPKVVVI